MLDSRWSPANWQHLCATIVSVCDNCVTGLGRSARHSSCDFFGRFECNSRYRRSASAKKRAERASSLRSLDHTRQKNESVPREMAGEDYRKKCPAFFRNPAMQTPQ
jgi:hypothetical protein